MTTTDEIQPRPRPKHITPNGWCAVHYGIRKGGGLKCVVKWGDPFVLKRCRFGDVDVS